MTRHLFFKEKRVLNLLMGNMIIALIATMQSAGAGIDSRAATNLMSRELWAADMAASLPVFSMDLLEDKHKLEIGDRLSFRIVEDQEDPKAMIVTDSGDLEVPYIGRYPAQSKTCKLLARELKAELEKEFYYQATVIIAIDELSKTRGRIYIIGAIRVPGPQEIPSDETFTLSKAVMRAGGFLDYADKKRVKVTRKSGSQNSQAKTFTINAGDVIENGKTEQDILLEAGDLIFIPTRLVKF